MLASVGWNHARPAEHLDLDGDKAGALRDAVVVVVRRRAHHPRHAARDAAFERAAVEPGIGAATAGGARATIGWTLSFVSSPLLRLFGQRRHATVGRIDDQRRAERRHLGAAIPPEVVVGA